MNASEMEAVPDPVARLLLNLRQGWRPAIPALSAPTKLVWGGEDMSKVARELVVRGDVLQVLADDLLERFLEKAYGEDLRNKPFAGELKDGSTFTAETAFLDVDHAAGHYWTLTKPSSPAQLWVAPVNGLDDGLMPAGNLTIEHRAPNPDGSESVSISHTHHRFKGRYTYYLVNAERKPEKAWFIVIDTGTAEPPSRRPVYQDMLALQFVLGRAFHFDVLHGVDDAHRVVGLVGGRHGRDHGSRGQIQAPVPIGLPKEHWPSVFFAALSDAYERRPELRLYIPLSYYLDALASLHVENRYLVLHIALEALSYWLLGGDAGEEQPLVDKPKWKKWLQDRKAEIMALAVEGQETTLFGKITSVPRRRAASRVVESAFKREDVALTITEEMARELDDEGRGLIVHTAVMFKERQEDVDAYRRRIAIVRTMLVGLVGRIVGYRGAISGWEGERGHANDEPNVEWWPVDVEARRVARARYVARSNADRTSALSLMNDEA